MIVLSHYQAKILQEYQGKTSTVLVSPDLERTQVQVVLGDQVEFPGSQPVSWDLVSEIVENENKCFRIDGGEAIAIQEYSPSFGRVYTLYPTPAAPTMLVSGIPMHRIKGITPWEDTAHKIRAFGRVGGQVLDTATGLGYTAIRAAEHAERVVTVELDPAAQSIARQNPWSQALFENPKIHQEMGDSSEMIETFLDGFFSGVIHDPPMFSLAGDLYALDFYRQVHRVLKPRGVMFHYIGNPESKSGGSVTRGVMDRLARAGFSRVLLRPQAFGVIAYK